MECIIRITDEKVIFYTYFDFLIFIKIKKLAHSNQNIKHIL
jgi:hypothetical protein